MKKEAYSTAPLQETAVLVAVSYKVPSGIGKAPVSVGEYLDELASLVTTAGAITIGRFTQKLDYPNPKTFLGKGKLEELLVFAEANEPDMIVFDDELSPSQIRNLEAFFKKIKIIDRSSLILDIFAKNAQTAQAKMQVDLAQCLYLLPRLTRMWTHLQKQKGGIGMKGPGEKEIETDRRIIRDRIAGLKKDLENIDKQMATQRGNRGALVRVALVGYTNVGKSTLMNLLSKSEVYAENKLFATLDTTVRKVVLENLPFLLSDTVGFIRKLPHQLIESFKSTLDETRESDLLIHVVDISHPKFEEQMAVVQETLLEIGAGHTPVLVVFNKIDAVEFPTTDDALFIHPNPENEEEIFEPSSTPRNLDELKHTWMARIGEGSVVFISARDRVNLDELRAVLYERVKTIHAERYPYNNYLY